MLEIGPIVDHPPHVLGTTAQNKRWVMTKDFDAQDDEEADLARHATKQLCEAIKELCAADTESPSIAAGWAMLFQERSQSNGL